MRRPRLRWRGSFGGRERIGRLRHGRFWRRAPGKAPLVLLLDEAHMLDPEVGRELLNASQEVGRDLPFLLVLAGTPNLQSHLGQMGASFWNRAEQVRVGRLSGRAAARGPSPSFRAGRHRVREGRPCGDGGREPALSLFRPVARARRLGASRGAPRSTTRSDSGCLGVRPARIRTPQGGVLPAPPRRTRPATPAGSGKGGGRCVSRPAGSLGTGTRKSDPAWIAGSGRPRADGPRAGSSLRSRIHLGPRNPSGMGTGDPEPDGLHSGACPGLLTRIRLRTGPRRHPRAGPPPGSIRRTKFGLSDRTAAPWWAGPLLRNRLSRGCRFGPRSLPTVRDLPCALLRANARIP